MKNNESNNNAGLKQDSIGTLGAVAIGICGAAPALVLCGAFGLLLSYAETGLSFSVLVATIIIGLIAVSYLSLSKKYNSCGGNFAYINSALGPKIGAWAAFIYLIFLICSTGQPPAIFNTYLNNFIEIPSYITMLFFVIPMIFIALKGVEINTKIMIVIWVVQMILLFWPPISLLMMTEEEVNFALSMEKAFTPGNNFVAFSNSILLWVWTMVGFEFPAFMGEELRGGSKAVRNSIIWILIGMSMTYIVFSYLYTALLTPEMVRQIAGSDDALAMICKIFHYSLGTQAVSIAAMVSCWASALAFYSLMPRFLYDLGRKGVFSDFFCVLNDKQLPKNAIIIYGLLCFVTCLYDSYCYVDGYFDGINDSFTMQAISCCIIYILVCVSNIKESLNENGFVNGILAGKIIPLVSILILCYLVYASGIKYLMVTFLWMLLGLIFVAIRKKYFVNSTTL